MFVHVCTRVYACFPREPLNTSYDPCFVGGPPLSCSKVNPQSDDSDSSVSGGVPVESKTLDDKGLYVQ